MKKLHQNIRGVAQLALIVVAIVVVAGVGYAAWQVMKKDKKDAGTDAANTIAQKIAQATCDYDDKDLCKFFTSYKEHTSYKVNAIMVADGQESRATIETQGEDRSHIVSTGGDMSFELISIGKTTYTKAPNGTWWKQTLPPEQPNELTELYDDKLEEPSKNEPEATRTQYKKIGTEACGTLTCFKYQVVDPEAKDETQFIWFDTKDYQLRRQTSETPGNKADWLFAYDKVTISEPSPVKELGPNQYLLPGQNEPMTLPTTP